MLKEGNTSEVMEKSRAEEVREEAVAATHNATRAMEAEAEALRSLEEALIRVDEAVAEVKSAIQAEEWARSAIGRARGKEKQAFALAEEASRAEASANKDRDRKEDRLRAEDARVANAERKGKQPNLAARDAARHAADEAGENAVAALNSTKKARETLELANLEVKEAQERAAQASAHTYSVKEAEAEAKANLDEAEHNALLAAKNARTALQLEDTARKTLDLTIKKVKALKLYKPRPVAVVAPLPAPLSPALVAPSEVQEEMVAQTVVETAPDATAKAEAETFAGLIRLIIPSPVDPSCLRRLHTCLEQGDGFRVRSVGGDASGGAGITVSTAHPVDMLEWLRSLEFVERVSKRGRQIVVTLRSEERPAPPAPREDAPSAADELVAMLS